MSAVDSLDTTLLDLQRRLADAIAVRDKERERCAKIAESIGVTLDIQGAYRTAQKIAAAIRSGK